MKLKEFLIGAGKILGWLLMFCFVFFSSLFIKIYYGPVWGVGAMITEYLILGIILDYYWDR